ncbi:MAG TPA: helix-turn-helix domain-containing protein [Mycobacteriales bacterium]|nr:helix-turn-helix domain-containing protein [Mycobacteriales bacterium]
MSDAPGAQLASVDLAKLGQRLRATRVARGMTQETLAGTDISGAYVSRIEAGQRRPEPRVAQLLADRLGTTVEFLVTGVEPQYAEEVRLQLRYAELALNSGEAADAETQVAKLLTDSANELGPLRLEAEWIHARSLEAVGRLEEAATAFEQIAADRGGRLWLPAVIALCRCYRDGGDLSRSIDVGETALRHARELGLEGTEDAVRLAVSLIGAYYERGDELYALQLCRATITAAERLQSPTARASAYWNASIIASRRGELDEAIRLAEKALALMADTDDIRSLARLRQQYGLLLLKQSPPDAAAAEQHVRTARRDLGDADGSSVDLARCDVVLARARLAAGDADGAEQLANQAFGQVADQGPFVQAEAAAILGIVEHQRGNRDEARRRYRSAVAALTAIGADRAAAALWFELGALFDEVGDAASARDAYRGAAAAFGLRATTRVTQLV